MNWTMPLLLIFDIYFWNNAYAFLTLDFIDKSWELKNYTLATYPFSEQHVGDNIVEDLKEVLNEYSISCEGKNAGLDYWSDIFLVFHTFFDQFNLILLFRGHY